jgi:hypothetical protein
MSRKKDVLFGRNPLNSETEDKAKSIGSVKVV